MLTVGSTYYILLLATCCISVPAATISDATPRAALSSTPAGARFPRHSQETPRMSLDLPHGFRPQSPPMQPLLYPFVSAAPSGSSDWEPIAGHTERIASTPLATTQRSNTLLHERTTTPMEEGPVSESVVYGAWKPNPPVQPSEIINTHSAAHPSTPQQNAAAYEQLGQQHPIAAVLKAPTFVPKNGRRRVAAQVDKSTESTYEVITLNVSDPQLLALAKQINDSAESVPTPPPRTAHKTNKSTWPRTSDSTETDNNVSRVWPTDFTASNEAIGVSSAQRINFSYLGDSSDPPQALNSLNIPNALLTTQTSFNITKVGVPYEHQSSTDEATICVPLTVREHVNTAEWIDVERVYCFPLPQTEVEAMKRKDNGTATKAKIQNVTEYEAANSAKHNLTEITLKIIISSLSVWLLSLVVVSA